MLPRAVYRTVATPLEPATWVPSAVAESVYAPLSATDCGLPNSSPVSDSTFGISAQVALHEGG